MQEGAPTRSSEGDGEDEELESEHSSGQRDVLWFEYLSTGTEPGTGVGYAPRTTLEAHFIQYVAAPSACRVHLVGEAVRRRDESYIQ